MTFLRVKCSPKLVFQHKPDSKLNSSLQYTNARVTSSVSSGFPAPNDEALQNSMSILAMGRHEMLSLSAQHVTCPTAGICLACGS